MDRPLNVIVLVAAEVTIRNIRKYETAIEGQKPAITYLTRYLGRISSSELRLAFPGASYEHQPTVTENNESGSAETGLRLQVHRHQTLISTTENSDGSEKASYVNLGYMLMLRLGSRKEVTCARWLFHVSGARKKHNLNEK